MKVPPGFCRALSRARRLGVARAAGGGDPAMEDVLTADYLVPSDAPHLAAPPRPIPSLPQPPH
jgi:hypothetical protein